MSFEEFLSYESVRKRALGGCYYNCVFLTLLVGLSLVPVWPRVSLFVFLLFVLAALVYSSVNLLGVFALRKGHLPCAYAYLAYLIINSVGACVHAALVPTKVQGLVWTWSFTTFLGSFATAWFIVALRKKNAQGEHSEFA